MRVDERSSVRATFHDAIRIHNRTFLQLLRTHLPRDRASAAD